MNGHASALAQQLRVADRNPWDWGIVRDKDGNLIEPGACEGYHNGENQRDLLAGDEP